MKIRNEYLFVSCLVIISLIYILYINSSFNRKNYGPIDNLKLLSNSKDSRYVFIDLGANKGDSIRNFLGYTSNALGGKLSKLISIDQVRSKKWLIYAFEANPYFDTNLQDLKEEVENEGHHVFLYKQTAAWIYDGKIDFYLDTVNRMNDFWGSSLNVKHPDVEKSGKHKINISCVDVARIIKQYNENDFMVVKMDIEGAEYELLIDFLKKDVYNLIDYITVEYHQELSTIQRAPELFDNIFKFYGIKSIDWN
jgi:FkbM family methyltransferase